MESRNHKVAVDLNEFQVGERTWSQCVVSCHKVTCSVGVHFIKQGTMEEKIYERQIIKEALSERVVDEHQLDRHFNAADLQELYRFCPDRLDDPDRKEKPTPNVPKVEVVLICSART